MNRFEVLRSGWFVYNESLTVDGKFHTYDGDDNNNNNNMMSMMIDIIILASVTKANLIIYIYIYIYSYIYQLIYIYISCDIGLCLETIFVDAYEAVENKGTYCCLSIFMLYLYQIIRCMILSLILSHISLPISLFIHLSIHLSYLSWFFPLYPITLGYILKSDINISITASNCYCR